MQFLLSLRYLDSTNLSESRLNRDEQKSKGRICTQASQSVYVKVLVQVSGLHGELKDETYRVQGVQIDFYLVNLAILPFSVHLTLFRLLRFRKSDTRF